MTGAFASMLIVLLGIVAVVWLQRRRPEDETRLVLLALATHVAASLAQVLITLYWYGAGDMTGYAHHAQNLFRYLDHDFSRYGWELLQILLQRDGRLPVAVLAHGDPTGSMIAIVTFVLYPVGGSLLAGCLILSIAALMARILILRVFQETFPAEHHGLARVGALFVPSVTFWGAGLAKETVALIGLGVLFWGTHALIGERGAATRGAAGSVRGVASVLLGGACVWLVKPYILVAYVIAGVVWLYLRWTVRGGRNVRLRTVHVFGAVMIGALAVSALSSAFPQYALDSVAEEAATLQVTGTRMAGGSSYSLGNAAERSFLGQLAFAPLALLVTLFRPLIFEARNALMFVNALETTWIMYLAYRLGRRARLSDVFGAVQRHPLLGFCATFVLVLGVGVGIATSNMGTLTRYRMPLMPFYVLFLLLTERLIGGDAATHARSLVRPGLARPASLS